MTATEQQRPSISRGMIFALLGLAIGVAVLIAVLVSASGSDDASPDDVSSEVAAAAKIPTDTTAAIRQVSFIGVEGEALPAYDPSASADPAVGLSAPSVTASHFDNTERTIDFADGTPRVVMFLAHWCPHCQNEVDSLTAAWELTGVPEGAEIVAVSTGVDPAGPNHPPSDWFLAEGWPLPVLRDSEAREFAQAFGLTSFPFVVGVAGDGTVLARAGQMGPDQFAAFVEAVAAV